MGKIQWVWLIVFMLVSSAADAANAYRYKDDQGHTHIDSYVTEDALFYGYDVLDSQGQVVRTVDRALTQEEVDAMIGSEKARLLEAQRQAEQAKVDALWLRLYATPEGAERARDRELSEIDNKMGFQRGRIIQLTSKLNNEMNQAAEIERNGRPVPDNLKLSIESINQQIADAGKLIDLGEGQLEEARARFAPIVERLVEIKGRRRPLE